MSGAIARITGPIWATVAYSKVGAWLVFGITSGCQLVSFLLLLLYYREINEFTEDQEEKKTDSPTMIINQELLEGHTRLFSD